MLLYYLYSPQKKVAVDNLTLLKASFIIKNKNEFRAGLSAGLKRPLCSISQREFDYRREKTFSATTKLPSAPILESELKTPTFALWKQRLQLDVQLIINTTKDILQTPKLPYLKSMNIFDYNTWKHIAIL